MWHPPQHEKSWLLFAVDCMLGKSTKVYRNQGSPLTSFPLVWRSSQMWHKQQLCVVLPSQAKAKGPLQMQTFWISGSDGESAQMLLDDFEFSLSASERSVESLSSWKCQKLVPWVLSVSMELIFELRCCYEWWKIKIQRDELKVLLVLSLKALRKSAPSRLSTYLSFDQPAMPASASSLFSCCPSYLQRIGPHFNSC